MKSLPACVVVARRALHGASFALLAATLATTMPAALAATDPPSRMADIQPLAEGAWLLPGRFERGRQPDGNSVLLQGRDGLVLIDSGRHAEHTGALIDWARARGQAIDTVFNTHWHLDHLGGNALLREAFPQLRALASTAVRDAVEKRMPGSAVDLRRMLADPALDATTRRMVEIDVALLDQRAALAPDQLVAPASHDLVAAGRRLRVGVERGVSAGDLWVLDEASGTLVIGDFVTLPVPFLDTACAEEWRAAFDRLGRLPFRRVVPGHGAVMDGQDFRAYVRAFDRLLACGAGDRPLGECAKQWTTDLGPLMPEASRRSVEPMLGHYFGTLLRAAPAEQRRFCAG